MNDKIELWINSTSNLKPIHYVTDSNEGEPSAPGWYCLGLYEARAAYDISELYCLLPIETRKQYIKKIFTHGHKRLAI